MYFLVTATNSATVLETTQAASLQDGLNLISKQLDLDSLHLHSNLDEVIVSSIISHDKVLYLIEADNIAEAKEITIITFNEWAYLHMNRLRFTIKAKTTRGVLVFIDTDTENMISPYTAEGRRDIKITSNMLSEVLETDVPFDTAILALRKELQTTHSS